MINQHNLREYVNLHSYTDSVGWIGYYCRKGRFTTELKIDAISQFTDYFQRHSLEASVITTLYKCGKHEISLLPDEDILMKTGIFRQFSDNENVNDTLVLFEDCGWNEIKLLSSIVMDNAGDIAGHCFIILNSLGLIAYPHDDTGFGFISIGSNGSAKDIVRNFLINLNPDQFQYEVVSLAIYDNDSYLLKVGKADRHVYDLCDKFNMILNKRTLIESNLPSYKIRRKKYHISCSYDGFIVVSQDFKSLYDSSDWQGLIFYPIQKSKGFYLTECTQFVEINKTERPIEYNHKCSECNAYVGVYGSIPPYIDLSVLEKMKPNVFYRSDIEFGNYFEKSYSLFISEEIAKSLIANGLITYKDLTEVIAVQ